jgi:hypothetical protein
VPFCEPISASIGTSLASSLRVENDDVNPARAKSRFSYREAPVLRSEHAEGAITRLIEHQAAKIPSNFFLVLALGAMCVSAALELRRKTRVSRFIGMWPGPLLVMGVYNKLVKVLGPR